MSNELYFMFDKESELLSVRRYFLSRKHYHDTGGTLVYENKDTEFVFTIAFFVENSEPDDLPEVKGPHIIVSVSYFRPMAYIQEIILELEKFHRQFSPRFYDETTGRLAGFSLTRFESEWKKTNQAGLFKLHAACDISVSEDKIVRDVWKWNYERESNGLALGDEYFFPRVMFRKSENSVSSTKTMCTWTELIPVVIPCFVTDVVVLREVPKSRGIVARIFGTNSTVEFFSEVIPIHEIERTGAFEHFVASGIDCFKLKAEIPDSLRKRFLQINLPLQEMRASMQLVSQENVVEETLVA